MLLSYIALQRSPSALFILLHRLHFLLLHTQLSMHSRPTPLIAMSIWLLLARL